MIFRLSCTMVIVCTPGNKPTCQGIYEESSVHKHEKTWYLLSGAVGVSGAETYVEAGGNGKQCRVRSESVCGNVCSYCVLPK